MALRRPVDNERTLAETAAIEALSNRSEGAPEPLIVVVRLRAGRADVSYLMISGSHTSGGYVFLYSELADKLSDGKSSLV